VTRSGAASAGASGASAASAAAPSAVDASLTRSSPELASRIATSLAVASWTMTSLGGGSGRTSIATASMFPLSVRASANASPARTPESAPAIPLRPPAPSVDASLDPPWPAAPPVDGDPLSGARCPGSKPRRSLQDADGRTVPNSAKIHAARRSNSDPPIAGGYCRCLKIMARPSKTPRRRTWGSFFFQRWRRRIKSILPTTLVWMMLPSSIVSKRFRSTA
jgi:hypothetical protein